MTFRVDPVTFAGPRTTLNSTGSSEVAVAASGIVGVPNSAADCNAKVSPWFTLDTSSTHTTSSAAATLALPACVAFSVIVPLAAMAVS